MKRTTAILALLTVLTLTAQIAAGQVNYKVKPQQATADDYIKLLNFMKYETFSFDVSSLADSTRTIQILCREYDHGKIEEEKHIWTARNRTMISDFGEEDQKEIHEEGSAYDEANDVYCVTKKILIGFTPLKNDSTEQVYVDVENNGCGLICLKVKPAVNMKTGETHLEYLTRPFKVATFQFDTFIPLVLYGNMWYDENFDIFRFCGENELDPDMSSDMLKEIPHYHVIGMKVK